MRNGLVLILICILMSCTSAISEINKDKKNIALQGFDVVSYFKDGKALQGKKEFSVKWKDAIWYFANEESKKLFEKKPEKYEPQYGGYCAWAVGNGYTAPIDPQAWKIVDHKLYLNYNKDIQKEWEKDIKKYIKSGNKNWTDIKKKIEEEKKDKDKK